MDLEVDIETILEMDLEMDLESQLEIDLEIHYQPPEGYQLSAYQLYKDLLEFTFKNCL